jgi:hypothetical protein
MKKVYFSGNKENNVIFQLTSKVSFVFFRFSDEQLFKLSDLH